MSAVCAAKAANQVMEMQKYAAEQRKEERKRNRLAVRQLDCQTDDKLEINLTITSKWTRRQSTCEFFVQIETRLCVIRAQGRMKECKTGVGRETDKQKGMQTNLLLATGNWQTRSVPSTP